MKAVDNLPVLQMDSMEVTKKDSEKLESLVYDEENKEKLNKIGDNYDSVQYKREGNIFTVSTPLKSIKSTPLPPPTQELSIQEKSKTESRFICGNKYELKFNLNTIYGNTKAILYCPKYQRPKSGNSFLFFIFYFLHSTARKNIHNNSYKKQDHLFYTIIV
jgi:hypothetical protein